MPRNKVGDRKAERRTKQAETLLRLGLPADTDCSLPVITVSCGRYVKVEHHNGILQLSGEVIRLYSGLGAVRIEGLGLAVSDMNDEIMLIDGRIRSVSFEQFGRKTGYYE